MHNSPLPTPLFTSQAAAPPQERYLAYVKQILETKQFTNAGPLCMELERKLADTLNVPHISLCTNGTLALQLAIRACSLEKKEVITTPFSYVATTSALLWEQCQPVFADIDPETLCIDPACVENAITEHTAGIMPVHVYGNACDVDSLDLLCSRYALTCIYDAAHALGASLRKKSLLHFGHMATCSLHATKQFHTGEGGGIVSHSEEAQRAITLLRAFGHIGDTHIRLGINAKMSELHAAMGLSLLPEMQERTQKRKTLVELYNSLLPFSMLRTPTWHKDLNQGYSYYPVILPSARITDDLLAYLARYNIFPKRYFNQPLHTLPYITSPTSCPVCDDICQRVICLPLYTALTEELVTVVAHHLAHFLRNLS